MLKWILIVGLALVAILSFVLLQGPLSPGPASGPSEPPAEQSEDREGTQPSQPSDEQDDPPDDQQAEQAPSQQARDVMAQARQAQGGLEALQGLNGYQVQASSTATQQGQTFSLQTQTWVKLPNQFRQDTQVNIQGQTINSLTVWDGQTGWVRQQGQVQQLQANQAGSVQQNLFLDPLHILVYTTREDFQYAYQGTETVNGTEAHAIRVTLPQGQAATFYFDAERFLPIQRTRSAQGRTVRTVFSNYQQVDAYAFPFQRQTYLDGNLVSEQTVEDVQIKSSFDPQLFSKPQTGSQQSGQ